MKKILILDIETTGFLKAGGKIVEIGIVELDLETGDREIIFDSVCHEKGITKEEVEKSWIVNNSSLTVEAVRHSPELETIREKVQSIINSYELGVTAYNNAFDFGFMEDRGFSFPVKLPCPMKLSTNILKIHSRRGYKWPSVEESYRFFFQEKHYFEDHRGARDAFDEARIVKHLYDEGVFKLN